MTAEFSWKTPQAAQKQAREPAKAIEGMYALGRVTK